jgi:hypothetical protein
VYDDASSWNIGCLFRSSHIILYINHHKEKQKKSAATQSASLRNFFLLIPTLAFRLWKTMRLPFSRRGRAFACLVPRRLCPSPFHCTWQPKVLLSLSVLDSVTELCARDAHRYQSPSHETTQRKLRPSKPKEIKGKRRRGRASSMPTLPRRHITDLIHALPLPPLSQTW